MTSDLTRGFASGVLVAMLVFSSIWYLADRARGGQRLPADWLISALHAIAMMAKAVADGFESAVKDYRYMRKHFGKESGHAM